MLVVYLWLCQLSSALHEFQYFCSCIFCHFLADVLSISIFAGGVLLIGVGYFCVDRRRRLAETAQLKVEHTDIDSEAEHAVANVRRGGELHDPELAELRLEKIDIRRLSSEPSLSEKVQQKKVLGFSKIAQKIPLVGSLRVEDTSISFATTLETTLQY
jgi:hypothetical protein